MPRFSSAACLVALVCIGAFWTADATAPTVNTTATIDLLNPAVFNPYFYASNNPDLPSGDIPAVQTHWVKNGVSEGRQGCGSFHTVQYLANYPDIQKVCKKDYACAINHYLMHGISEKRVGFAKDGAPYGRWTIADIDNAIWISASKRMAGAIDSVVYETTELINMHDHGRELQLAVTNGYGECFNPTEGGSSNDDIRPTSTSVLQGIDASSNVLNSQSQPAFWLAPGQKEPQPGPTCTVGINTGLVSNYTMTKSVSFRPQGINKAIEFAFQIEVTTVSPYQVQIEGPTGYMGPYMNVFYSFSILTGAITKVDNSNGEVKDPLIFSNADGSAAMGCMASQATSTSDNTISYAKFDFSQIPGGFNNPTTKWSTVFRHTPIPPVNIPQLLKYTSYLCVGSLPDVVTCMQQVARIP